jgi:hypothetical protein
MNKQLVQVIAFAVALFPCASALAQDVTVAELKSKGAIVLSPEELKTFLPGKTARYEVPEFVYMVKLEPNGSLTGSHTRRLAGRQMKQFIGDWNLSDEGRWCMTHRSYNNRDLIKPTHCRDILKLADSYYYASGDDPASDERRAWPVKFSRY